MLSIPSGEKMISRSRLVNSIGFAAALEIRNADSFVLRLAHRAHCRHASLAYGTAGGGFEKRT
jgi:hypothetical protein